MDRTRRVFAVILVMAFVVILFVWFLSWKSSIDNRLQNDTPVEQVAVNTEPTQEPTADIPVDAVVVTIASSNTKQNWLDLVSSDFNDAQVTTSSGKPIVIEVEHVTSGGSMNAILDGSSMPTVWSPGVDSWVQQANDVWQQRANKPITSSSCPSTVYSPLGFAMWRPMAEVLGWPDEPVGWDTIVALAEDPDGWASYGRPEWGTFQFGHTHPAYSNSGLLSMTSFVYGVLGREADLTAKDVYSPKVETAMYALEQTTSRYGREAPVLLELMAREGPGYLHAVTAPEADTLRFYTERRDEYELPLAFIIPSGGTIWANHPYCILDNTEWVTAEQAEAATIFRDYLLAKEQQALAIDSFMRPLDSSIPLHAPLSLENGTDPRVTPDTVSALSSPDAELSRAIIDMFYTTKRKATILIVIDVSTSMRGKKIETVRTATTEFLSRLDANDEVGLLVFADRITTIAEPDRVGDVVESLRPRVQGLVAQGSTNLHQAVCEAVAQVEALRTEDLAADESRLYGIVLLSDGEDTIGEISENRMLETCLPNNAEVDGIKIFPIAFGTDADEDVLQRIATATAGRVFTADPESIGNVYTSISAEQ